MMRSNLDGVVSRTSITYLKASGKASGNVNLPTPITAAPTTNRKWGRRNPTNLKITDLENFTSSCSTQFPKRCLSVQVHDAGARACNFQKSNPRARIRLMFSRQILLYDERLWTPTGKNLVGIPEMVDPTARYRSKGSA